MTNIEKKFSLLNDIDNAQDNIYYFDSINRLVINDIYMNICDDTEVEIILQNNQMTVNIYGNQKFVLYIDCDDLKKFFLFLRGE